MRAIIMASLLLAGSAWAQDPPAPVPAESKRDAKPEKKGKSPLVDLNSATPDDLKALPGMTDELAAKIIAARPYSGKAQLLKQNIVDKDEYTRIRRLVHAKPAK